MENQFALSLPQGDFDLTPDRDCRMVYVNSHHDADVPKLQPIEIPDWFFAPDTIWFYFDASETEDKVTAGSKLKNRVFENLHKVV